MKKIMLLAGLLLTTFAQAQVIEVTGKDGEVITNGYEFVTNSLEDAPGEDGYLPLHVENLTNETIYIKLKMDNMINADGNSGWIQFCFGTTCYFDVDVNDVVPANIEYAMIIGNGTNPEGDKFTNAYEGDTPGQPVEYHMSFWQYNAANEPVGDTPLLSFKYIYDATAGTTDFTSLQNIGINIQNTLVKNTLDVNSNVSAQLELFDITGKKVSSFAVANGANAIDLSGLNAAVYIAKFTTEENKTSQIRIVKN